MVCTETGIAGSFFTKIRIDVEGEWGDSDGQNPDEQQADRIVGTLDAGGSGGRRGSGNDHGG